MRQHSARLSASDVLRIQRTSGNRAVLRLLRPEPAPEPVKTLPVAQETPALPRSTETPTVETAVRHGRISAGFIQAWHRIAALWRRGPIAALPKAETVETRFAEMISKYRIARDTPLQNSKRTAFLEAVEMFCRKKSFALDQAPQAGKHAPSSLTSSDLTEITSILDTWKEIA